MTACNGRFLAVVQVKHTHNSYIMTYVDYTIDCTKEYIAVQSVFDANNYILHSKLQLYGIYMYIEITNHLQSNVISYVCIYMVIYIATTSYYNVQFIATLSLWFTSRIKEWHHCAPSFQLLSQCSKTVRIFSCYNTNNSSGK